MKNYLRPSLDFRRHFLFYDMKRKLTTEEFIERARQVHGNKYDYSKTIYIETSKEVTINCPIHGFFIKIAGNHLSGRGCKDCNIFLRNKSTLLGLEGLKTKEGYEITILEYIDSKNCTIKLNDLRNTILYNIDINTIRSGKIKNPWHPSVCGVGYLGIGEYKSSENSISLPVYNLWYGILSRCYNQKKIKNNPAYKDCTVGVEWHNFQNFAQWFYENYKSHMQDWHLDKDILLKDNKIYSPETCTFVPKEINQLFVSRKKKRGKYPIGVSKNYKKFRVCVNVKKVSLQFNGYNNPEEAFEIYKFHKEAYIKEVADKWKDQINPRVYEAMYNWIIEITD